MESKCYETINKMCPKQIGILEFYISTQELQRDAIAQLKEKNIQLSLIDNIVYYKHSDNSPLMHLGFYQSACRRKLDDCFDISLTVEIDLNLYSKYLFEGAI